MPKIPATCIDGEIGGEIEVSFYVNKKGRVDKNSIKILNPDSLRKFCGLEDSIVDMLKRSKWKPAKNGKKKVGTTVTETIKISFDKK